MKASYSALEGTQITMDNIPPINASSWMPSPLALSVALRWLRRCVTLLLVFANLALTLWATTAR